VSAIHFASEQAGGDSLGYWPHECRISARKIGPANHFEEEQVLWCVERLGGRKVLGRQVLAKLILFKDGRSDGRCVYFLNLGTLSRFRGLLNEFGMTP